MGFSGTVVTPIYDAFILWKNHSLHCVTYTLGCNNFIIVENSVTAVCHDSWLCITVWNDTILEVCKYVDLCEVKI